MTIDFKAGDLVTFGGYKLPLWARLLTWVVGRFSFHQSARLAVYLSGGRMVRIVCVTNSTSLTLENGYTIEGFLGIRR